MQTNICGRSMHYSGNLELIDMPAIAIVGSRNCTELGARIARSIARHFAGQGFVIVSGLAKGIDTAAHQGALDIDGRTIAVLGTDLGHIYPRENMQLSRQIVEHGGLLCTEYDRPEYNRDLAKKRFTDRDQIIVDLSEAVIPVQAELRRGSSGTMTTAVHALEQNKPVFVPVPTKQDCQLHPSAYDGINKLLELGCISFTGKSDYPNLIQLLEDMRIVF